MKKCNLCDGVDLMKSSNESKLVPGVHYTVCTACGNVMMLVDDVLIPTPQTNSEMTKLLIQDAADAFGEFNGRGFLRATSLNGTDFNPEIQPTQVKEQIKKYIEELKSEINEALNELEEESLEDLLDEEFDCDQDCDQCEDGCPDFEEKKEEAIAAGKPVYTEFKTSNDNITSADKADYLLIDDCDKKHVFKNCSKDFVLNIINSAGGSGIKLFEIKEIKLKEEIKYSF